MTEPTRPTLILLHGAGQNPTAWQGVVEHLDPTRPMHALWLKGFKPTDALRQEKLTVENAVAEFGGVLGDFSMAEAAAEVGNFLELHGIERADLVGYNVGGLVALRAAAELSAAVAHLVVVSTSVVPSTAKLKSMRRLASLMPKSAFPEQPKELVLQAMDAMIAADLSTDLDRIQAPTLSVTATSDPSAAAANELLQTELRATVKTVDSPTPNLLQDAPQELAALIEEFLAV